MALETKSSFFTCGGGICARSGGRSRKENVIDKMVGTTMDLEEFGSRGIL